MNSLRLIPLLTIAAVLAACSAGATQTPTPVPATPASSGGRSATETLDVGTSVPGTDGPTDRPPAAALDPWMTTPLEDVRTGETFTIADLAGKLVVIEPMAIWCPSCARQQREARSALEALDRDDIVYISLGVDPGERAADLAAYADEGEFPWRFAVAGRELSRELARALGDQVLSPPSTPKIIVTPQGEVLGPDFGMKGAADLETELRDLLG